MWLLSDSRCFWLSTDINKLCSGQAKSADGDAAKDGGTPKAAARDSRKSGKERDIGKDIEGEADKGAFLLGIFLFGTSLFYGFTEKCFRTGNFSSGSSHVHNPSGAKLSMQTCVCVPGGDGKEEAAEDEEGPPKMPAKPTLLLRGRRESGKSSNNKFAFHVLVAQHNGPPKMPAKPMLLLRGRGATDSVLRNYIQSVLERVCGNSHVYFPTK